jgi:hypothetical protein
MIDTRKETWAIDSKAIRVSREVYDELQKRASHPREQWDSILRRALKLPPKSHKAKRN